jgi:hypothetical protein
MRRTDIHVKEDITRQAKLLRAGEARRSATIMSNTAPSRSREQWRRTSQTCLSESVAPVPCAHKLQSCSVI